MRTYPILRLSNVILIIIFLNSWNTIAVASPIKCEKILKEPKSWQSFYNNCLQESNIEKNFLLAIDFFINNQKNGEYNKKTQLTDFFVKMKDHDIVIPDACKLVKLLGKNHEYYNLWFKRFNCKESKDNIFDVNYDNDNPSYAKNFFSKYITNFEYKEWLKNYTNHFLFPIHALLAIVVLWNFLTSLTIVFNQQNKKIKQQPLMVDYYVQNINRRYYLYAEMFLLTGLAGAALAIQGIFDNSLFDLQALTEGTSANPRILEVRKGVAFSAAGIVFAVICYTLRTFLLARYKGALETSFETKANNASSHTKELKNVHALLEQFLNRQTDSIVPIGDVLHEIKTLNNSLNSNVIQRNFTKELEPLLDRLASQTEERLLGIATTVNSAIELIQESRENLNSQFKHSQNFLMKLEDLEARLNHTGNDIANRMEYINTSIHKAHDPFLDNVKAIHINLTDTTEQITNDLKMAHETLREKFVDEVRAVVQIQRNDVEQKNADIRAALEETVGYLKHSFERTSQNALEVLSKGIEQTNQQLYQNISTEHATYIQKIEKYQDLLTAFQSGVDVRIEEASKIFKEQIDGTLEYYRSVLRENEGNNKEIQNRLLNTTEKLQTVILDDFIKTINNSAEKLVKSLDNYPRKTEKIAEIEEVKAKLIKKTLDEFGFSAPTGKLERFKYLSNQSYGKLKNLLKRIFRQE